MPLNNDIYMRKDNFRNIAIIAHV
ncbi:uncharacterized protein METZ01_LOCUS218476, partial [marine metagenome]